MLGSIPTTGAKIFGGVGQRLAACLGRRTSSEFDSHLPHHLSAMLGAMLSNRCARCCMDFNIEPLHLFFPERMPPRGQEFVAAHELDAATLGELRRGATVLENGNLLIQHRCPKLTAENLCSIYEKRPAICREFVCASRADCIDDGGSRINATLMR